MMGDVLDNSNILIGLQEKYFMYILLIYVKKAVPLHQILKISFG